MSRATIHQPLARLALASLALAATGVAHAQCVSPLQTFAYSGAIVPYSVPSTGDYWIEAAGAEGGNAPSSNFRPGRGAIVGGKFHLTGGTSLSVLVGQQPPLNNNGGNGGGGGSFVVLTGTSPFQALVVGGGGAGSAYTDSPGKHGQASQSGATGTIAGGAGGSAGSGGGAGASSQASAGGGGLLGNGADGTWFGARGGQAFANGGSGGASTNFALGGFGGGGAGSYDSTSGGGGGYSGGGGGVDHGMGGGGGSFNAGADPVTLTGATDGRPGNGQVRICTTNAPAALAITPAAPSAGVAGSAYGPITLTATGGLAPYTWSAASLPSGLNLNPGTGVISGTPAVGTEGSYTLTVTDSYVLVPHTASVTLQILPPLAATAPAVATEGQAYNAGPAATGGVAPHTWTAASLPVGLTLDPATGALTGTPAVGSQGSYTLTVTDNHTPTAHTADVSLQVVPAALAIGTSSLPSANNGLAYNAPLAVTGGTAPYTLVATGLPNGLSVAGDAITGTPTQSGSFAVVLSASDGGSPTQTASVTLDLSVTAADVKPVPTLGEWSMGLLAALAAGLGLRARRRA